MKRTLAKAAATGGSKPGAIRFRTTILQGGKTATGIQVPAEVVGQLSAGKKPPVRVTINGFTYRSTIAVMGGRFMVGVSAENREKAGVAGGDEVAVEIQLDTDVRTVAVPPDFAKALDTNPNARQRFEALSHSRKQWFVLAIEGAKTPETRQRRIEKALTELLAAANT